MTLSVEPRSLRADGKAAATATVAITGVGGEPVGGQHVTLTASGPALAGFVTDKGGGVYTATITATHRKGKATITASDATVDPAVTAAATLRLKRPAAKKPKKRHGKHKHKRKQHGKHASPHKHKRPAKPQALRDRRDRRCRRAPRVAPLSGRRAAA
jgi:hypothetical protein